MLEPSNSLDAGEIIIYVSSLSLAFILFASNGKTYNLFFVFDDPFCATLFDTFIMLLRVFV